MTPEEQRRQHGLNVYVDPHRCIGMGKCTTMAPGIFVLNEETRIAEIQNEDQATVEQFFAAARSCPTQAIIIEQYGRRVYPRILPPMFGDKSHEESTSAETETK